MYCEFKLMTRYGPPSIQLKLRNDDATLMLDVVAFYRYRSYRFSYSSMNYEHKQCLEFLTSNKLAIIYQIIKETDMKNYKFPTIYKLKLTSKALMYAL